MQKEDEEAGRGPVTAVSPFTVCVGTWRHESEVSHDHLVHTIRRSRHLLNPRYCSLYTNMAFHTAAAILNKRTVQEVEHQESSQLRNLFSSARAVSSELMSPTAMFPVPPSGFAGVVR